MSLITPTKEQISAIESDHNKICILACAGSGKTFTLTKKIARLFNDFHVDPSKIIAITFTVMAANKLKIELSRALKEKYAVSQMFVGTIHSFCSQILKQAKQSELDEFQILTESQQFVLLNRFWSQWEIEKVNPNINKTNLIERLISSFNIIKMESINLKLLEKRHPEISRVFKLYNSFLEENSIWDFADLISKSLNYLKIYKELREETLNSYAHLFVDEYQDVDPLQAEIIELFGEKTSLCVVGDDDQSIYQFRGTDVRNILNFSKSPKCRPYVLTENRRCPRNILTIAENCIKKVPSRYKKSMFPVESNGVVIREQFEDLADEVDYIRKEIQRLVSKMEVESYGNIAILMRSVSSYGQVYIDALKEAGIPYIAKGGRNLFDTEEVTKVVSVLEWFIREPNQICHLNLIKGIFSGTLDENRIAEDDEEIGQLTKNKASIIGLTNEDFFLLKSLLEVRENYYLKKFGSLLEIVIDIISSLGLMKMGGPEIVSYNIGQLTQIIDEFEEIADTKKMEYLCGYFQSYAQKAYDEAMPIESAKNAVNILTVHQAKGLEFDYVFIPMLVELRFPVSRNQNRWLIDDDLFHADRYFNSEENERRLFYVACTRAKRGLYLLCSKNVGLVKLKKPSLFFEEAIKVRLPDKNVIPKLKTKWVKDEKFLVSSYSSLEYYLTCPFRYKLLIRYNLATPSNPFFQFGKVIHAVLGHVNLNLVRGKQISLADAEFYYDTLFDNYYRNPNIPNYVVAKQKLRGKRLLGNYYRKKNSWFDKVKLVETDFEYVTGNALVRGRYDLVLEDTNKCVTIVDFKTGAPHDYLRTDFQMQVYSLAGSEQLKLPVKNAILYYIEENQELSFSINESFLNEGKKNLEYIIEGIISENFDATPGGMCPRCEVKMFCEEYKTKGKKHERKR